MKKNLSILFSIIILSAAIGLSVRFVFAQLGWEEPTDTPPFDNEIPLWIKNGNDLYHTIGGNVGIGSTSPQEKMDIGGILRSVSGHPSPGKGSAYGAIQGWSNLVGVGGFGYGAGTIGVYGNATYIGILGVGNRGVYGYAVGPASFGGYFSENPSTGDGEGLYASSICLGSTSDCKTAWSQVSGAWTLSGNNLYPNSTSYNVGIGTATPSQSLDVRGNAYISGNTGIGTTSPNDKLEVAGNIRLSSGFMIQAVGGSLSLNADSTNNIKFLQDGTVKAGIYGGKFGIGTNQPSGTLTVLGDLKVFSYNASTYKYGRGPNLYRMGGTSCGCDLDPNTVNCPPLYYTNTNYGANCIDKNNRGNYAYLYTRYDNAPALYVSTLDRVGIGTAKPQTKLDVAGDARFENTVTGLSFVNRANIFQIDTTDNYYSRTVGKTYVVEVGPSRVGSVVRVPELEELCYSEVGYRCQITLGMKNWDTNKPNLMTTRGPYHFSYTGSWWRVANNDVEGKDNNGATNEWKAWDCYFTDAETLTNSSNGRADRVAGFGLLNAKGGSYSDSSTGCVLIVEDITGALVKTGYLINGIRTETECTKGGGTVTTISGGDKICRFAQGSCPSPWLQYNSWSVTTSATCNGDQRSCWGTGCGGGSNCTTGNHAWSDTDQETCGYKDEDCDGPFCDRHGRTCRANITAVGCY